MPKTLFETLAGYPSPAAPQPEGMPDILGGPAPVPQEPLRGERTEEQFPAIIARLQAEADKDPAMAKKMADAFGIPNDPVLLRQRLEETRKLVEKSQDSELLGPAGAATIDYEDRYRPDLLGVPKDFGPSYIKEHVAERLWKDLPDIDLDAKSSQFEDDSFLGVAGWILFNGLEAVKVPRGEGFHERFGEIPDAQPFRRHDPDSFVYPLAAPADGGRLRVALFADFGTGLGHARFIGRQIQVDGYHAAVHLGDVYYTGTVKQYDEYFIKPLEPAIQNGTKLFIIPDNHDGYCGFHAYTAFIDRLGFQKGSYFAIETKHVQFIGMDTIWHGDRGRLQDDKLLAWLKARLKAGRDAGRANVLLTGHEPYEFGKNKLTELNDDVMALSRDSVDLWFWGNTHYCALFGPGLDKKTPYFGSCIGHAGYPYKRPDRDDAAKSAAPVLWAEYGSRYEPEADVRVDRGMNGFCSFEIEANGDVDLRYVDWRGQERCAARFKKQSNGRLQLAGGVVDHTS